jgi:hypothetical protein
MAAANFTRAAKAHPSKPKARRKPAHPGVLKRVAAKAGPPATGALREIRATLEIAMSVVYISAATLRAQSVEHDSDVALCLQRCAGDELHRQIERIDRLITGGV